MENLPEKYNSERKNYIRENMKNVIFDENLKAQRLKRQREKSEEIERNGHHVYNKNFGKLPDYVIKFRQDKESE